MPILDMFTTKKEEDESCFPSLSWNERLTGFVICFVLGFAIEIMSFGSFVGIIFYNQQLTGIATGKPERFAIMFSVGNVIALFGTMFLVGPSNQFKNMTKDTRLYSNFLTLATIVFILSLIMTLISALVLHQAILVVIFLVLQTLSYIWYTLSYIPFARTIAKKWLKSCCN